MGSVSSFEQLDALVESCYRDQDVIGTLRPSTLEGCVVRVSDMIAYIGKDRQDAIDRGLIPSLDVFESDYIGVDNARIINNMTADIVNCSYGSDRIRMSEAAFADLKRAKQQNYELIYGREGTSEDESNVVQDMFCRMYGRLREDVERGDESSAVFKHHIRKLCERSRTFTQEAYLAEGPDAVVMDYLASMTDDYFLALYRHLFPGAEELVRVRGYCSDL